MSVIITDFSKNDIIEMSGVMSEMNAEMNNIKSVDGLIDKIENTKETKNRFLLQEDTKNEIIDIIKEYCEV